jgi:hypothetical protein
MPVSTTYRGRTFPLHRGAIGYVVPITTKGWGVEGFHVITSDDCKLGEVAAIDGDYLIIEHGTLRKTRHAVPQTFAHADESERVVRLSVSKDIVCGSPKVNGEVDRQAIAQHYGLADAFAAPETEGYGDMLPDDPARSAQEEEIRQGMEPADQQRAALREGGMEAGAGAHDSGESPALLGDRLKDAER